MKSEIENRFSAHSILSLKCLAIIPSCFSLENSSPINDDELLEFFDIECTSLAKAELHLWCFHFTNSEKLPDSPQSALTPLRPKSHLSGSDIAFRMLNYNSRMLLAINLG